MTPRPWPRYILVICLLGVLALMVAGAAQCHGQVYPGTTPSAQVTQTPVSVQQPVYLVPSPGPANIVRRVFGWPLLYAPVQPYVLVRGPAVAVSPWVGSEVGR
jgi:hypothetical protein